MNKLRPWLALLLAVCMLSAVVVSAHPFTDVADGSWYSDAVDYVYDNGLMKGIDSVTFNPAGVMNRAMIVTVLHRMAGSPAVSGSMPFVDVPADTFYYNAVIWAYQNGIVKGVSATEFAPGMSINRAQLVTMFYRYYCTGRQTPNQYADLSNYSDIDEVPAFAYEAFQWAVAAGVVKGMSETTLGAGAQANRAQCATIIERFAKVMENNPTMDYSLSLEKTQMTMVAGTTETITATYDGPWVLAWESSDTAVATVVNGTITAVRAGTAYITVSDGVKRAQCKVTVEAPEMPPEDYVLTLSDRKVEMLVGETMTLDVTYTGYNALVWKSTHEHIVTVSQDGEISAVAEGTGYITVTDGVKNATCKVVVTEAPVLAVTVTEKTMVVGDIYQVNYTYTGDMSDLSWYSRNEEVATVDNNGVVTAVAAGNANIVVTDGTTSKQCRIKVVESQTMATEIVIGYTDGPFYDGVTRYKDDYVVVTAINKPNEAGRDIVATSSDSNIVTVSSTNVNGNSRDITLTFKAAGTATITLTSGDGAVSQSYTITVKDGYDFDPGDRQLTPEEFADYTTKVMCANGFTFDSGCTSWRQFTRSADELNFDQAVVEAYSMVHSWWPNGCRYCQIVYIGQDDNGDYVFHECWG